MRRVPGQSVLFYRNRRIFTPVAGILMGLEILLFLVCQLAPDLGSMLTHALQLSMAALTRLQVWRLVTYCVVVPIPATLIGSLLALFFFGSQLENAWGSARFALFYALMAAGTGLIYLVATHGQATAFGFLGVFYATLVACAVLLRNRGMGGGGAYLPLPVAVAIFIGITVIINIRQPLALVWLSGVPLGYFYTRLATGGWPRRAGPARRSEPVKRFKGIDLGD